MTIILPFQVLTLEKSTTITTFVESPLATKDFNSSTKAPNRVTLKR